MTPMVRIIGGGLAGCEAAWQAASMRVSGRHSTRCGRSCRRPSTRPDELAELVCSNSFRGDKLDNAVGLLKEEMRRLGSLIMRVADRGARAGRRRARGRSRTIRRRRHRARSPHIRSSRVRARRSRRAFPASADRRAGHHRHRPADVGRAVGRHRRIRRTRAPRVLRRDQPDRAGRNHRHVEGLPRVALEPQSSRCRRPVGADRPVVSTTAKATI